MHIAIAGNIGAGKTTLTELLAKHYKWTPHYEDVDENPYLNDFYNDMQRWSFNLQIYFLNSRFKQIIDIRKSGKTIIQDRTIYEDAEIFARNLFQRRNMSDRDYHVYRGLYQEFIQFLPSPDLIIYLKASVPTLIERIHRRGRDFEREVSPLYLQQLNELYNAWVEDFTVCPILTIPADDLDFVRFDADFVAIREKIIERLASQQKFVYK